MEDLKKRNSLESYKRETTRDNKLIEHSFIESDVLVKFHLFTNKGQTVGIDFKIQCIDLLLCIYISIYFVETPSCVDRITIKILREALYVIHSISETN